MLSLLQLLFIVCLGVVIDSAVEFCSTLGWKFVILTIISVFSLGFWGKDT